jgi:hypothetical protein
MRMIERLVDYDEWLVREVTSGIAAAPSMPVWGVCNEAAFPRFVLHVMRRRGLTRVLIIRTIKG